MEHRKEPLPALETRAGARERPPGAPGTTSVPGAASGRGTVLEEIRFLLAALRLFAVLLAEWIFYVLCGISFLFFRSSYRSRMRRIIIRGPGMGSLALLALLILCAAPLGGGCAGKESAKPRGGPGSFKAQMRNLGWSVKTIADQSDSKASLENDLEALRTEKDWKDQLDFSVRGLFLMPEGKKSLEQDLEALGDPDHKRHGLRETLQLLGW